MAQYKRVEVLTWVERVCVVPAGEVSVEKPVVMRIAETMAGAQNAKKAAEEVAKQKKVAEEAKNQARALQVGALCSERTVRLG